MRSSDFVIDCTGLEADIREHRVLADLLDHSGAGRNPLGRLDVERNFEVSGTRSATGSMYASGSATLGGYFPGVDTFLGLQIAAQEIADDLAKLGLLQARSARCGRSRSGGAGRAAPEDLRRHVLPTLYGRIQTRIFLIAGRRRSLDADHHAVPAHRRVARRPVPDDVRGPAHGARARCGWEFLYHGLQQFRWEKDWPTLFGLSAGHPRRLCRLRCCPHRRPPCCRACARGGLRRRLRDHLVGHLAVRERTDARVERPLALQGRAADLDAQEADMTLSDMQVCVARGAGLVARQGSSVVVLGPLGARHDPFIDRLLELLCRATEDQPSFVRRIGALVTGTPPESVPAFGILVQTGDSIVALLAGEVALAITTSQGVETHEGKDASTYLERRLNGDYESLWLAAADTPPADRRSRLTSGVVPGAGVLLSSRYRPARHRPATRRRGGCRPLGAAA